MWNFGFSYNTSKGLLMYRDFNMVISPIYPLITGLLMSILGSNMISFYLINATYVVIIAYIIYKYNKNILYFLLPFLIITCLANYNTFCILLCILLIYLERKKSNDYLIGFIIGIAFLTKINVGFLLCLPTLYFFKDFKKIGKRILGFLIPNIITILFFLIIGNLKNYISYVFLGVLDFANNNVQFSYFAIIIPIIFIYLIYLFFKEKKINYLYAICFLGLIYPVMNELHVLMAVVPTFVVILDKYSDTIKNFAKFALIFTIIPFIGLIIDNKQISFSYDDNVFKYRYLQTEYIDNRNSLISYFDSDFSHVCFVTYDNYLYKFLLNLPINKYDLILYGNMGYHGTEKMINYLKSLENDHYFVLESVTNGAQFNKEVINYVQQNYKIKAIIGNFYVFHK